MRLRIKKELWGEDAVRLKVQKELWRENPARLKGL